MYLGIDCCHLITLFDYFHLMFNGHAETEVFNWCAEPYLDKVLFPSAYENL